MKRKYSVIYAVLLLWMAQMFLMGCDGRGKVNEIKADSFPQGHTLSLPASGTAVTGDYVSLGISNLKSQWDYKKQLSEFEANEHISLEAKDSGTVQGHLIKYKQDEATSYFFIMEPKDQLFIFTPSCLTVIKAGSSQNDKVLFPLNKLQDEELSDEISYVPVKSEASKMASRFTSTDEAMTYLVAFYEASQVYDLAQEDDALELHSKDQEVPSYRILFHSGEIIQVSLERLDEA